MTPCFLAGDIHLPNISIIGGIYVRFRGVGRTSHEISTMQLHPGRSAPDGHQTFGATTRLPTGARWLSWTNPSTKQMRVRQIGSLNPQMIRGDNSQKTYLRCHHLVNIIGQCNLPTGSNHLCNFLRCAYFNLSKIGLVEVGLLCGFDPLNPGWKTPKTMLSLNHHGPYHGGPAVPQQPAWNLFWNAQSTSNLFGNISSQPTFALQSKGIAWAECYSYSWFQICGGFDLVFSS